MSPLPFDPDLGAGEELHRPSRSPFVRVRRGRWRRVGLRLPAVLAVAFGGAVGGSLRYGADLLIPATREGFPWPTFTVNVAGAFLLGLLLVLILEVWPPTRHLRPLVAVGLLGSLTTFSTWMVEFDQLLAAGATALAVFYLGASLAIGLAATGVGLVLGRGIAARRAGLLTTGRP